MTILEQAKALREIIKEYAIKADDKTLVIAANSYFPTWTPAAYVVGDVRLDENSYPYECIVNHDSISNPAWNISERTLWKPYHSRKKEYALPWIAPTGAHDMYLAGEYMVYTDGKLYVCKSNTSYSPANYSQAWEVVE